MIGTQWVLIPGDSRGTVWANAVTGGQDFSTEVTSTQNIIAERAMYWPTGSSLLSGGETLAVAQGTETDAREGPPLVEDTGPPSPYTLTEGVAGPTQVLTTEPASLVVGKPVPGSLYAETPDGLVETQSSSGLSWYGSHLAVGKKP